MKKKHKLKFRPEFIIVGIAIIGIAFFLFTQKSASCTEGEISKSFCVDQKTSGEKKCIGGKWVTSLGGACSSGTNCDLGQCLTSQCSGNEVKTTCSGELGIIAQTCLNGIFENKETLCPRNSYCDKTKNSCVVMPQNCGNGACDSGENPENCWRDCGSLSSWNEYYESARTQPNYEEMTKCTSQYNCDTPEIKNLSDYIMKVYEVATPKQYIDAVIDYSFKYGFYDLAGGYKQAGETATDILINAPKYGQNCVDYTVLSTALLRQKGIMVQQEYGVVGVRYECKPLAFQPPGLERLGNIAPEQVFGHSWITIWTEDKGWIIADPTIGATASKCVNYRVVGKNSDYATAYIPSYESYM